MMGYKRAQCAEEFFLIRYEIQNPSLEVRFELHSLQMPSAIYYPHTAVRSLSEACSAVLGGRPWGRD